MGWKFEELGSGKNVLHGLEGQNRFIYDTSDLGYANTGHTYGDGLSVRDRRALLEYLKTL